MREHYHIGFRNAGVGKPCELVLFKAAFTPSQTAFPHFFAVMGPFRTKRGALYMQQYGRGNPHVQCVRDAEELGKLRFEDSMNDEVFSNQV